MSAPAILSVRDLRVRFPVFGGIFQRKVAEVRAVDGIHFDLQRGETLALVGESGCGKSTTGKALINVLHHTAPDVIVEGQAIYQDEDTPPTNLLGLSRRAMRPFRSKIQMVFQDPYSSLNPRLTVGRIVEEPLLVHTRLDAKARERRVAELLEKVGLGAEQAARYPHEFSGGQRQRIGIARALATNPRVVICDEPVSALDVSIQAQVINLLQDLQEELGLSYLFVAHDLSVVKHIANRIAVMYLGNIVELGTDEQVYHHPRHPYSQALLSAVPQPDPAAKRRGRIVLEGDVPTPLRKPSGCGFRTRCPVARAACAEAVPPLAMVDGREVACPYTADMDALVAGKAR